MTSLKQRMDNVIRELTIIKEIIDIDKNSKSPPCDLTFMDGNLIKCESLGPLPKEEFLKKCKLCLDRIKSCFADQDYTL